MINNRILYLAAHSLIGLGFSFIHIFHIARLYENGTKFSHLSSSERELSLSPKEAFYYQFYKRLIETSDFEESIDKLVYDNLTEFNEDGSTINSIRKFHIMPEIFIAFMYKQFMMLTETFNIPTTNCYYVEPDPDSKIDGQKVFVNCEGFGEPIFFYLAVSWSISAITIFLLYMYGYFLHRSLMAGCAAVVYYFCIHESATSIHRMPMMRHNFAFPFILWQSLYMNLYVDRHQYDDNRYDGKHHRNIAMIISLIIFTTIGNLFWEMSSYIFLAQTFAIFLLMQCHDKTGSPYVSFGLVFDYSASQVISNCLCYFLMYENTKFLLSGNMSINIALLIYIFRMRIMRLPSEDENPNFRSPIRKFCYVTFFFLSTSWFVQDLMDRFVSTSNEETSTHHIDLILTMLHLKVPNFFTLLTFYRENVHDLVNIGTLRTYCVVFVFKNISLLIAIKLYNLLQQRKQRISEDVHEMRERAKNYVIEDFLESNRITMKDLSDSRTEKKIQENLRLLERCSYDYQLYKLEKKNMKTDTRAEKENFLNDIKKLKTQISEKERMQQRREKTELEEQELTEDLIDENIAGTSVSEEKSESPRKSQPEVIKPESIKDPISIYYVQPYYTFALLQTLMISFVALKYVLTPFLCLLASTIPSRTWFKKSSSIYWIFYMFLVGCTLNYPGIKNIRNQYQQKREFRNPELENLIQWIERTEPNAVFGAPIEISAHILLTTKRPIVNHPLIEYPDMADRTRTLYSVFSKQSSTDVYNQLVKLRVQYVVIPYESCFLASKEGIRLTDIFDYIEPENYDKKAFCVSLFQKTNPTFLKVFENLKYIVIQIFSQSIQLEFKKNNILEYQM